jgi:hypothetical protein
MKGGSPHGSQEESEEKGNEEEEKALDAVRRAGPTLPVFHHSNTHRIPEAVPASAIPLETTHYLNHYIK